MIFEHALDKDVWTQMGRWNQKPLPSSFWINYHQSDIPRTVYPAYELKPLFVVDGYFWYQRQDYTSILNDVVSRYQERKLDDVVSALDKAGNDLMSRYELAEKTGLFTSASLADLFAMHQDLVSFWWLKTVIGEIVTKAALQSRIAKSESDFFEMVHPYLRKTWIEYEEAAIKNMAQYLLSHSLAVGDEKGLKEVMASDKAFSEMVQTYLHDFRWVGVNKWEGESNSVGKLMLRLQEGITNVEQGNYVESSSHSPRALSELDQLVQLAVITAYWRPVCGGLAAQFEFNVREKIKALGEKHDLTYDECLHLTQFELVDLEHQGQLSVSQEDLRNRIQSFAMFLSDKKEVVTVAHGDKDYMSLFDLYATQVSLTDKNVFKGVPACKGFVTGKANVITRQADFGKFQDGDILIAPETTPSFVPLMRKASAIITERGGITSHAAIVSRELKVPCVIAVVGITSAVKDGDELEVDANKGIIRVIKR